MNALHCFSLQKLVGKRSQYWKEKDLNAFLKLLCHLKKSYNSWTFAIAKIRFFFLMRFLNFTPVYKLLLKRPSSKGNWKWCLIFKKLTEKSNPYSVLRGIETIARNLKKKKKVGLSDNFWQSRINFWCGLNLFWFGHIRAFSCICICFFMCSPWNTNFSGSTNENNHTDILKTCFLCYQFTKFFLNLDTTLYIFFCSHLLLNSQFGLQAAHVLSEHVLTVRYWITWTSLACLGMYSQSEVLSGVPDIHSFHIRAGTGEQQKNG